jgi:hypothetical protein
LWQRSSDIYVAVVRVPDRPHLCRTSEGAELIPGENHWETRGYHLLRNGERLTGSPIRPGGEFALPEAGEYTAVAVEWSGLESEPSSALTIAGPSKLRVRTDAPADFTWTKQRYLSRRGEEISREDALRAAEAIREIVHLNDGVIHRERLHDGQRTEREDLNLEGKPIRRLFYDGGKLARREYHDRDGNHISTEYFDTDGFIVQSIGHGSWKWTYKRGEPTSYERRSVRYVRNGDRWVGEAR